MADLAALSPAAGGRVRPSWDRLALRAAVLLVALWLLFTVALPLAALLIKSVQNAQGGFVGLANFQRYFATPTLIRSLWNSLWVALATTAITLPLAYGYAFALTRTAMPFKRLFGALALIPILAPSLLPAIGLIYLFGNQGLLKSWAPGGTIYGPAGIIIAQVFYGFPQAFLILVTALGMADARIYEAAEALGAGRVRRFMTVTLPGTRYGLVGAGFVLFALVVTDFGVPKVIGGQFAMLATDIYKQVVGQQNFNMGAVIGLVLLVPAGLGFIAERLVQRRQTAALSARAVPLAPVSHPWRDRLALGYCLAIGLLLLGLLGVAGWASFVTYWPYNLALTLANYDFAEFDPAGWGAFATSIKVSLATATLGTVVIFVGAYALDKSRDFGLGRTIGQFLALLPMAVPGLVLGLGYIFFFNAPGNPLGFLYGTIGILVVNSIAHFYTVGHLTATSAVQQLDPEFEAVSASLKVPVWRTFLRVTVPVCLPAILDIWIYLFVNAMTTVSALIFLYGSDSKLAAIAVVHMDEAGATAGAAAMSMVIVATSAIVKLLQILLGGVLDHRTQAWRRR